MTEDELIKLIKETIRQIAGKPSEEKAKEAELFLRRRQFITERDWVEITEKYGTTLENISDVDFNRELNIRIPQKPAFDEEENRLIVALAQNGWTDKEITKYISKKFGHIEVSTVKKRRQRRGIQKK